MGWSEGREKERKEYKDMQADTIERFWVLFRSHRSGVLPLQTSNALGTRGVRETGRQETRS